MEEKNENIVAKIEVIKPFLSLKKGDILHFDYVTGKYKFAKANEDISEFSYSFDDYEIALDLWVVDDYMGEYFVAVKEVETDEQDELVPEEVIPIQDPMFSELGKLKELVMRLQVRLEGFEDDLKFTQKVISELTRKDEADAEVEKVKNE